MMEYFLRFWGIDAVPRFRVVVRRLPPDVLGEYRPPSTILLSAWNPLVYFHELAHHVIYHLSPRSYGIVEEIVAEISATVAVKKIPTRPGVGWGLLELGRLHRHCRPRRKPPQEGRRYISLYGRYVDSNCVLFQYLAHPHLLT